MQGHYHSYFRSAKEIIGQFNGEEPLSSFLKKYFSTRKKYGSRDRKEISHLCYCYYRLGKMDARSSIDEKILTGLFLCFRESHPLLTDLKQGWNDMIHASIDEKLSGLHHSAEEVFPWRNELSAGIDHKNLCQSFFIQPNLFLRIRPGHEKAAREKLSAAGLEFGMIKDNCVSLSGSINMAQILELDKEAVIQDLNSQRAGELLQLVQPNDTPRLWDCCAGSGGKSILARDILGDIELTVTDIRESILANLRKRFQKAGIKNFTAQVLDLSRSEHKKYSIFNHQYSIIILDAPCTGSGTWARTPEQLYFFDEKKISEYASLQKKIISNVVPRLQKKGYFLYITCSVFKKENEEIVDVLVEKCGLQLIKKELLTGYDKKADSLFAALLQKTR